MLTHPYVPTSQVYFSEIGGIVWYYVCVTINFDYTPYFGKVIMGSRENLRIPQVSKNVFCVTFLEKSNEKL